MKKRILSLLLAAAMVFTSGVMVAGVEADAAGTAGDYLVINQAGNQGATGSAVGILARNSENGIHTAAQVQMGDVLSIAWPSNDNAGTLRVWKGDGYTYRASADNTNVRWYRSNADLLGNNVYVWEYAGSGATYTTSANDIGYVFTAVVYNYALNADVNGTTTPFLNETDVDAYAASITTNAAATWIPATANGTDNRTGATGTQRAMGIMLAATGAVQRSTSGLKDLFELDQATYANGAALTRLGNIIVAGTETTQNANYDEKNIEITFKAVSSITQSQLFQGTDRKSNAIPGLAGADAVRWSVLGGTGTAAGDDPLDVISAGAIGVIGNTVRNISVQVQNTPAYRGTYYNAYTSAVQTNYKLAIITGAANRTIYLMPNVPDGYNMAGTVGGVGTGFTSVNSLTGSEVFAFHPLNAANQNRYELPTLTLITKNNSNEVKYFQGWGTKADATTLVAEGTKTSAVSKTYYAIWGDTPKSTATAVYRLYNPKTGEHLYTSDYNEYVVQGANGWKQEDISWYGVDTTSWDNTELSKATRVRRLYNKVSREHLYVLDSENEMNQLLKNPNWVAESVVFIAALQGTSIYRLFNPKAANAISSHLWTTDANEMNYLRTRGWNYEGVPFFGEIQ